jgi:thymidylate kinase
MSKIITILGPDRVGKSTLCKSISEHLHKKGFTTEMLHFSGPKPFHHSPIDQYILEIKPLLGSVDFIICDRGGAEVCFYENVRRNLTIGVDWPLKYEDFLNANAEEVFTFLLCRDWEWSKPHHITEILEIYPECSQYWIESQLETRQNEHNLYYEYMEYYLDNFSKLLTKRIYDNDLSQDLLESFS